MIFFLFRVNVLFLFYRIVVRSVEYALSGSWLIYLIYNLQIHSLISIHIKANNNISFKNIILWPVYCVVSFRIVFVFDSQVS